MRKRFLASLCCVSLLFSNVEASELIIDPVSVETEGVGYSEEYVDSSEEIFTDTEEQGQESSEELVEETIPEEVFDVSEEAIDTSEDEFIVEDEVGSEEVESEAILSDEQEALFEEETESDIQTVCYVDEIDFVDVEDSDYSNSHNGEKQDEEEEGDFVSTKQLKHLRASGQFINNYGEELEGITKEIYNALVSNYSDNTYTGYSYLELSEPYIFETNAYSIDESTGALSWNSKSATDDMGYTDAKLYFKSVSQGAFDAFRYDYSETFWAGVGQYSCTPSRVEYSAEDDVYYAYVTRLTLNMKDRYTIGSVTAKSQVAEFNASVDEHVNAIRDAVEAAPTDALKIKVIHDHIVENSSYFNDYPIPTYVSSAASFFNLGGVGTMQCEGYSRAMIVLMHRFGFTAVLGSGKVSGVGHAWIYTKLDGKWYLIDPTFDDSMNTLKWLFCGYSDVAEEREFASYFSETTYQSFIQPSLANSKYHDYDENGQCSICGENENLDNSCNDGHDYVGHVYLKPQTSSVEDGSYFIGRCVKCNHSVILNDSTQIQEGVASGHYEWAEDGSKLEYVMQINGETFRVIIDKKYIKKEVVREATSTQTELVKYYLENDLYFYDINIGKTSIEVEGTVKHDYTYQGYKTEDGKYISTWVCADCGDTVEVVGSEKLVNYEYCAKEGRQFKRITFRLGDSSKVITRDQGSLPIVEHEKYEFLKYNVDGDNYTATWECEECSCKKTSVGSITDTVIEKPTCENNGYAERDVRFTMGTSVQHVYIDIPVEKLGHNYVYSGYEERDGKYFGKWVCGNCNDVKEVEGTVVKESEVNTCLEDGKETTTITFNYDGEEKVERIEEVVSAKGHSYEYSGIEREGNDYYGKWVCSNCNDEQKVKGVVIKEETEDATCTVNGKISKTVEFTFSDDVKTELVEEPIKAQGHNYEYKGYNVENKKYIGHWVCSNCDDVVDVEGEVKESVTGNTCEEDGLKTTTITFKFNDDVKEEKIEEVIKASGHNYEYEGVEEKEGKFYGIWVCSNCSDRKEVEGEVTESRIEPTCTSNGKITRTIKVKFGEEEKVEKKFETLEALGHKYEYIGYEKTNNGYVGTWKCSNCESEEKVTGEVSTKTVDPTCEKDGSFTTTIRFEYNGEVKEEVETEVLKKLGHSYGAPEWSWDGNKAVAKFTCSTCKEVKEVEANVESKEVESTCKEKGYTLLTASVDFNNSKYETSKKVDYKELKNHTIIGKPSWEWVGEECIVSYTCGICGEKLEDLAEVSKETVKPNCARDGSITYTAKYTINGTEYTNEKVEVIERTGNELHGTWREERSDPTCEENGYVKNYCSVCGKLLDSTYTQKLSHDYSDWVVERKATVLLTGLETKQCKTCGKKIGKILPTLTPTIRLNYYSLPLKVKQSTSVLKVVGMTKGDGIKSWTSSNSKIATVSSTGKIKAKKKGTCKITVTLNSGISASCTIKVQKKAVKTKSITVRNSNNQTVKSLSLKVGASVNLVSILNPITSLQKVVYSSSNKKIVSVSKKGVIKAKKKGSCKITIKSGSKKKIVKVKVN